VDQWIGDLMAEMEKLGVADNTIVIIMGDNGHFTKYSPQSGYTPMIFRGGKGATTEGGVRVDAFVRWPGMIEADSVVGDMVHVSDLYTTLARVGGATDEIPRDRVIDGLDQTALWLNGEAHGRRDYAFLYNINTLEGRAGEVLSPVPGYPRGVAPFDGDWCLEQREDGGDDPAAHGEDAEVSQNGTRHRDTLQGHRQPAAGNGRSQG
jgi:arylsulfatase